MIQSKILDNIKDKEIIEEDEYEIRFGRFKYGKFDNNIKYIGWLRLYNFLSKKLGKPENEKTTVSYYDDGIRRISKVSNGKEEREYQNKKTIEKEDIVKYGIRVAYNKETKSEDPKTKEKGERIRDRLTWKENFYTIDLTIVHENYGGKVNKKYEVEIEIKGKGDIISITEEIYKKLYDTKIVYNIDQTNSISNEMNNTLGKYTRDVLVDSRPIKWNDLVYGGIVGNKSIVNKNVLVNAESGGTRYAVTHKADGMRKLLYVRSVNNGTELWLIMPNDEYNYVGHSHKKLKQCLIDGEYVNDNIYLAFDTLLYDNKDARSLSYTSRVDIAKTVTGFIKKSFLNLEIDFRVKEYAVLEDTESYYKHVSSFLDKRKELDYGEDGLMFIPVDVIYNPESQKLYPNQRFLTKTPDVCKWKPREDITIDFSIKWEHDGIHLYSYDDTKKINVEFEGDYKFKFLHKYIDQNSELTKDLESGTIVEYEWKNNKMSPRRLRLDKLSPNKLSTAVSNWIDIQDPITEKDMLGISMKLVYKYHNRIKRALYSTIEKSNILDIGSGRGGDVDKWRLLGDGENVGYVVAVEPNPENETFLRKRINDIGNPNKHTVVPLGGEKTVEITDTVSKHIPGKKVDAITLMLSMSFFWSSTHHLDALVNTIVHNLKPGGKILFLTIDGDTVEEYFEPKFGGSKIKDLQIADAVMHLYEKNKDTRKGRALRFILNDTIVGDQHEFLVKLSDLTIRLNKYGFSLMEIHKADKQLLLPKDKQLYTSMYSYGYYQNTNKKLLSSLPKPINIEILNIEVERETTGKFIRKITTQNTKRTVHKIPKQLKKDDNIKMLSVIYTDSKNNVLSGKAIGDDLYDPLVSKNYPNLVRISCIGDSSCFVHAILKGISKDYQNNNTAIYRHKIAEKIRYNIGSMVELIDPHYNNVTYWESTSNGGLLSIYLNQLIYGDMGMDVDYSMEGIKQLLQTQTYLGDEVCQLFVDFLGADIHIFQGKEDDTIHVKCATNKNNNYAVCIVGNTYHYELIGTINDGKITTLFDKRNISDEFVQFLLFKSKQYQLDDDYNPDIKFITSMLDTYSANNILNIPDNLYNLEKTNPVFYLRYSNLRDSLFNYYENIIIDQYSSVIDKVISKISEINNVIADFYKNSNLKDKDKFQTYLLTELIKTGDVPYYLDKI